MRLAPLKHWALLSLPLLCALGAIRLGFDNEKAVADFFLAHAQAHPVLTGWLTFVTDWSNGLFYAIYAFMLFSAWRCGDREKRRFTLMVLMVQLVVSVLCVHFIKHVVGRPRPGQAGFYDPLTTKGTYHSFPSGHTTEIMGWSLPLALRKGSTLLSALMGLLIGLVGFSRVYLSWHHPSDVFFGWVLGSFGGFAAHVLVGSTLFRRSAR